MPRQLREYKNYRLLGHSSRCDKLVNWSQQHSPGKRYAKDFNHGLRLVFETDGPCPRVYFHWNQIKFTNFLKEGKIPSEHVFFMEFGVSVLHREGRTLVTLPGVAGSKAVLWDSAKEFCQINKDADTFWLVGMVRILENGFEFSTHSESQSEPRLVAPIARIRVGSSPAVERPIKTQ